MPQTAANVVTEWRFEAKVADPNPFNDVILDAVFTDPLGAQLRVPTFWAGGNVWKVRYASDVLGIHRFQLDCSSVLASDLNGIEGSVQVSPYTGDNPLYRHGPIRIAADKRHFEHIDGKPFLWTGDTWWMGLCRRLGWPADLRRLRRTVRPKVII